MTHPASADQLHPALRAFPAGVLAVTPQGIVAASNGRLERALERGLVGQALQDVLDGPSRAKLERMLAAPAAPEDEADTWELMMEGRDALSPHAFYVVRDDADDPAERVWLVECPRDLHLDRVYHELAEASSEQSVTERQLVKEKARLARAMAELERELHANDALSRRLQRQNEDVEAQNEELVAMTQELHAGQEQLLGANQQLEKRTRELQLALSVRNRFYAAMSHELRTPINAVMGYNDLLLAAIYGPLNEHQELAVERSQRAARHLRELVNDVLDISRLEAGKLELEVEEVEVPAMVEDLFATLAPLADTAGSALHLAADDVPRLRTDPRRLRQVLMNLISNAIKFGGGEPVWVRVESRPDGRTALEVTDAGPGIPEGEQSRIFDEFVQLARQENVEQSPRTGTGLGLSIARRLTLALGGRIEVASTPGVGSTFTVLLPPVPPENSRD